MATSGATHLFFSLRFTTTIRTSLTTTAAIEALLPASPELRRLPPFPLLSAPPRRGVAASSTPPRVSRSAVSSSQPEGTGRGTPEEDAPRWKPMCLYHTQGKCTMMTDSLHLEKFNHNFSVDLQVNTTKFNHSCAHNLDYLLILDLEGKVEILEFPVVVIDAKTADFVDAFHRPSLSEAGTTTAAEHVNSSQPLPAQGGRLVFSFCDGGCYFDLALEIRSFPVSLIVLCIAIKLVVQLAPIFEKKMAGAAHAVHHCCCPGFLLLFGPERQQQPTMSAPLSHYPHNVAGHHCCHQALLLPLVWIYVPPLGLCPHNLVWHDTAIPFKEVLKEFEIWMKNHKFWKNELGRPLHRAAFVTCGNWDLKTKIPQQCKDSGVKLPSYFMEWINLKDIYLNFYRRRATGMKTMMKELNIPLLGSHHLGIDDSKNIARVLQHMIADGAPLQITARRWSSSSNVEFLFEDRIR